MAAGNYTSEAQCLPDKNDEVEITLAVVYSIITVLGIAGNSLVINVVRQNHHMRTITNFMLVNLAVADILSVICSLPKRYFDVIDKHPSGEEGIWLCKLFSANNMAGITMAVSVYTLTLLAVERYHSIVRPFKPPRIHENNVLYALTATWIVATVEQIPAFIETTFNEDTCSCESPWTNRDAARSMRTAVVVIITLNVFFPIIVISFCYALIIKALHLNKTTSAQTFDPRDLRSKKKIVKLLIAVTLMFYTCFLPFGLYMVILASNYVDRLSSAKKIEFLNGFEAVKCMMYTSSCLNPVLYAFQSSNYRNGFKMSLPCLYRNSVHGIERTPKTHARERANKTSSICQIDNSSVFCIRKENQRF